MPQVGQVCVSASLSRHLQLHTCDCSVHFGFSEIQVTYLKKEHSTMTKTKINIQAFFVAGWNTVLINCGSQPTHPTT